jgi:hypothetical protein
MSIPEKYDLKGFKEKTQQLAPEVLEATRQKPIHYNFTFDKKRRDASDLKVKVNCMCILNVKKKDCSKFNPSEVSCKIKHMPPQHIV